MTQVVTHRGLDPSKPNYFFESSREAFTNQLARGYGLEFDVRVTSDGKFVIVHDKSLKRISGGADERLVGEATGDEIFSMELNGCHLTDLDTLCGMIAASVGSAISALHMKHESQIPEVIEAVVKAFQKYDLFERCIIFDTKIETAEAFKTADSRFHIAPSVAHEYDIERYNDCVGGTLYSVDEVLARKDLFDLVWLDEWDLADRDGRTKTLYNQETFGRLRAEGIKIGLVTPELHASSPGLLGGEAHQDAQNSARLGARIKEIALLNPDLMCTDYPDQLADFLEGKVSEVKIVREPKQ